MADDPSEEHKTLEDLEALLAAGRIGLVDVVESVLVSALPWGALNEGLPEEVVEGLALLRRSADRRSVDRRDESPSSAGDAFEAALASEHGLSTRDPLTGLPNRFSFRGQLEIAMHYAQRHGMQVSVLYVDLDDFHRVNDASGRDVGDQVLIKVAERMAGALRKSELIARVGGDEFLLMLQGRDLDFAPARTAERLLELLARPLRVEGQDCHVSASIGIANFPRDARDADTLIQNATAASNEARAEGCATYRVYGHAMTEIESRRLAVAERLRAALDRGDLRVVYQPRVDGDSGRVLGAEALLRWEDDELGHVSPGEFVPIAEKMGLMGEIGAWVMREACAAHQRWSAAGYDDLRISVNVTAEQLLLDSLRNTVVSSVIDAGMRAGQLQVELTETTLVANEHVAGELLHEFEEIGVFLELDDFGTGYSSLSYLRKFPVRTLKIDGSFVREILPGRRFPSFLQAILSMAHTLGLDVVAEGVETPAQREALLARGCREMQGFLFSRPVAEADFVGLLHSGMDTASTAVE